MANATKSTLFRQRLDNKLKQLADSAERVCVTRLPEAVQYGVRRNVQKMQLWKSEFSENEQTLLIDMLNSNWEIPFGRDSPNLIHYCVPGCCASDGNFRAKMKNALDLLMNRLFPTPLLYRWKYVEPALLFTSRGLMVHGLLQVVWAACQGDRKDNATDPAADMAHMDCDNADAAPSVKQQVRVGKVRQLLEEPKALVLWLLLLLLFVLLFMAVRTRDTLF